MEQQQPRRPSLLRALLAKDIRRERSHLLQCFRFLVRNNFLKDLGRKPLDFGEEAPPQPDLRAGLLKGIPDVSDEGEHESDEDLPGGGACSQPEKFGVDDNQSEEKSDEED